jgi:hypothetical protein
MFGPNSDRAKLITMTREPTSLKQLTKHADSLRAMARDIESVSFREIRETTTRTVVLVDRANREISSQVAAWEETRGRMREDGIVYAALRNEIAETQKIRDEEILRVRRAMEKSNSMWDGLLSFALAIISGVIASVFVAALLPAKTIRSIRRFIRPRKVVSSDQA